MYRGYAGTRHDARPAPPPHDPMTHDPDVWLDGFHWACGSGRTRAIRGSRITIMEQTKRICAAGHYTLHGSAIRLGAPSRSVSEQFPFGTAPPTAARPRVTTRVEVREQDCLEVAQELAEVGLSPVVLNMASPHSPGGGWESGAGAQEENLFRRTDYCLHLPRGYYPIWHQVVHTSNVSIFRSSEATGYAYLPEVCPMSFIALAAESHPPLVETHEGLRLTEPSVAILKEGIRTLFAAAQSKRHNALVLSALGCGAFCNPPDHVAEVFLDVLQSADFRGVFDRVVFAIFDDHNARRAHNPRGNFQPFRSLLHGLAIAPGAPADEEADGGPAPGAAHGGQDAAPAPAREAADTDHSPPIPPGPTPSIFRTDFSHSEPLPSSSTDMDCT